MPIVEEKRISISSGAGSHSHWLGVTWEQDAEECQQILSQDKTDWLIVDHYGLDELWERKLANCCRGIFVIDDLADRRHYCDLLLDQNLGRSKENYIALIPRNCEVFVGAKYALLRPEFIKWRDASLLRRVNPSLQRILITMGGVDQPNATGRVLETLENFPLSVDCQITVIMGATAPWLDDVKSKAVSMPWQTEVLVNVNDIARHMARSDLAIGAAGSTAWERCCLGLPTVMVILAGNQRDGAMALQDAGAGMVIGDITDIETKLGALITVAKSPEILKQMSVAAANICEGGAVKYIVDRLRQHYD